MEVDKVLRRVKEKIPLLPIPSALPRLGQHDRPWTFRGSCEWTVLQEHYPFCVQITRIGATAGVIGETLLRRYVQAAGVFPAPRCRSCE